MTKEVLTPMASQVSMYDTVMTSASMLLQYIKESSHDSNSNHYNPMAIKEPLDRKPTLLQHLTWNNLVTLGMGLQQA